MRSYCLYVEGYENRGLFVGMVLTKFNGAYEKIRKSDSFIAELNKEWANYSSIYTDYDQISVEKYFNR